MYMLGGAAVAAAVAISKKFEPNNVCVCVCVWVGVGAYVDGRALY